MQEKRKGTETPKRVLRALIPALVLMLALFWAQGQKVHAATGLVFIDGIPYDLSSGLDMKGSQGWKWDESSSTLTLYSNYAIGSIGFYCDSSDTIYLVYDGDVTVAGSITCQGSLQINGTQQTDATWGKLTINREGSDSAFSIFAYNLTINSGTIYLNDNYISSNSIDIRDGVEVYCNGELSKKPSVPANVRVVEGNGILIYPDFGSGIYAANSLSVSVDDSSIATVILDSSYQINVDGQSPGSTTATVTWGGGLGLYSPTTIDIVVLAYDAYTPIITKQPQNTVSTLGDTVTLSVEAEVSDSGTLTYQWYSCTNINGDNPSLISGATSEDFIPTITASGIYYYYVEVTNTNNNAQNNTTANIDSDVIRVSVKEAIPTVSIDYR